MPRTSLVLCLLPTLGGRAAAQPATIADENRTVVFGQNPAKVEVMTLPRAAGRAPRS